MAAKRSFGDRMRELRGDQTQADFAYDLGIPQQYISRYENGIIPNVEVLTTISEGLGVSIDWLLFGAGGMWLDD